MNQQFFLKTIHVITVLLFLGWPMAHGQRISTLLNERKPAGHHAVEFNGDRIAGGLYLYTISTEDAYRVGKMLLVK